MRYHCALSPPAAQVPAGRGDIFVTAPRAQADAAPTVAIVPPMHEILDFIVRNWILALVFVLSGGMLLWPLVGRRFSNVQSVGTARATQLVNNEDAVLLDVRETAEYEGGRLPNAKHIPLSQLGERANELAKWKAKPIVVYDGTGTRSAAATLPAYPGSGSTSGKSGSAQ